MTDPTAAERIALVADPGSFVAWDESVVSTDPLGFADAEPYGRRLAHARERTGRAEAVVCGQATVDGRACALVVSEFGFLGGSIGVATGERIARALDRACTKRLPVVALTASGGTRMQEGSIALVQMAKTAAAARRLREAGLPYLVCLCHPTTGGVLASWGSLGSVTFASPGALVGFVGPRVAKLMAGHELPVGVQTAENMLAHGLVDDLVAPGDLRERVARVLAVALGGPAAPGPSAAAPAPVEPVAPGDAWASLRHARDPDRPAARDLLGAWAEDVTVLRGDGAGSDDPSCLAALARLRGVPAVVIAQDRDRERRRPATMTPAGYRKARRAMALAEELDLPLVTFVDTPGAAVGAEAEEGGLAAEIARCLADLSGLRVPTLALLAGEGGSGGALALLVADRVLCAEHGSLSAIAPEGASAILYRDVEHAGELAAAQAIASWELRRFGIVDEIVPEPVPAAADPAGFAARAGAAVQRELRALAAADRGARLAAREARYREVGSAGPAAPLVLPEPAPLVGEPEGGESHHDGGELDRLARVDHPERGEEDEQDHDRGASGPEGV